ncbi:MAG: hypothetical protein JWO13_1385 [Acidobacteriales bacterium]|nr:hypothetical protein [Terriglobales bacterium]
MLLLQRLSFYSAIAIMLSATICFAAEKNVPAVKKSVPRWSRLQIQAATLTTGSGAPVALTNLDVELPPKEFKATKPTVIRSGDAFLTSEALTRLINDKIASTNIKDFKIETEEGQRAKISATMQKTGIPVPINIEGPVSLTKEGMLRLEIKSEKAGIIPIKSLAGMLGFSPEKSIKTKQSGAVRMEKDAVVVDPNALLGTAVGQVTKATTSSKGLMLRFGGKQ